ncbi:MAG: hypothetical protein FWB89_08325 [Treponema sp.]|nr:hypothetical protein [Treponema sp.]
MKKAYNRICYALSGIIIFIAAILIINYKPVSGNQASREEEPAALIKTDVLYSVIRDGDIICRLGDRFWSGLIRDVSITDKRFSHMGIIRINDSRITVINSEGDTGHGRDFVNEVSIEEFLRPAVTAGIYRINAFDGALLSELSIEYLGIPFDWKFDMYDASKLYCTELLYVICKRIMPELELETAYIKELKMNAVPLEAISNSSNFTEIFFVSAENKKLTLK